MCSSASWGSAPPPKEKKNRPKTRPRSASAVSKARFRPPRHPSISQGQETHSGGGEGGHGLQFPQATLPLPPPNISTANNARRLNSSPPPANSLQLHKSPARDVKNEMPAKAKPRRRRRRPRPSSARPRKPPPHTTPPPKKRERELQPARAPKLSPAEFEGSYSQVSPERNTRPPSGLLALRRSERGESRAGGGGPAYRRLRGWPALPSSGARGAHRRVCGGHPEGSARSLPPSLARAPRSPGPLS